MRKIERLIKQIGETKSGKVLWQKKPKHNTQKVYALGLQAWLDWSGKSLDQTVAEYLADVEANFLKAADKWQSVIENFGFALREKYQGQTPASFVTSIISLINANCPKSVRIAVDLPKGVSREITPVSKEDLREIDAAAKLREKALIRFLKDSGMAKADAVTVDYGQIRNQIEKGEKWATLRVVRAKENVRYNAFLGPNSMDTLRLFLNERKLRGETLTDNTPLLVTLHGKRMNEDDIGRILKRLSKRTGKVVSGHRIRKFFESYMAIGVTHPIILKAWMGHKVSSDIESHYIIPPASEQLRLYQDAYKNIDLEATDLNRRVEELEEFKRTLTPEQRAIAERINIRSSTKGRSRAKDCKDGHCQRIVEEKELETLLAQGYYVKAVLQSGRIVVADD
jgi:integrase/recombinase XerD